MLNFDASGYFANLLVLMLVVVPLYRVTSSILARQFISISTGALLLYYIAPRLVILYFLYWTVIALVSKVMLYYRDRKWATLIMWLSIILVLSPMFIWKFESTTFLANLAWFGHSLVTILSTTVGFIDSHRNLFLPIGLSFATFRALDLILQIYLGSINTASFRHILAYGFCPMLLPVGPIATLQEVDFSQRASYRDMKIGFFLITLGFVKVFLLASLFQDWGNVFRSFERPWWQLIMSSIVFTLYFYLNFSGYSDIAIGIGKCFGMNLPENFRWPLFRGSPQQFWANWHASLSRFAQRYIFTSVFSSVGGKRWLRQSAALLATMMVIAWWHDLTISWTVFGVYHGLGLIIHRLWSQNRPAFFERHTKSGLYKFGSWFLLFSFVVLGFPIISVASYRLLDFYGNLFNM